MLTPRFFTLVVAAMSALAVNATPTEGNVRAIDAINVGVRSSSIIGYDEIKYGGASYTVEFTENTCTNLPSENTMSSVKVTKDWMCTFWAGASCNSEEWTVIFDNLNVMSHVSDRNRRPDSAHGTVNSPRRLRVHQSENKLKERLPAAGDNKGGTRLNLLRVYLPDRFPVEHKYSEEAAAEKRPSDSGFFGQSWITLRPHYAVKEHRCSRFSGSFEKYDSVYGSPDDMLCSESRAES
ncbi:hypothetical protein DFH09DRAFT_1076778 [Mycena vulgaris]|nr:hypothetical protein DFH09DRAFT_1076778 [Mycena vulgaris]